MTELLVNNPVVTTGDNRHREGSATDQPLRILVLSGVFPSVADPSRGVFVKERVKAVAALPGCDVRVIAPTPWFPPIKRFSRWYKWSQYPKEEAFDGLKVYHPRYPLPPKIGGYFHPRLMYPAVKRVAGRLRREGFEFDVIDAHFVYPAGVVGAMLGQHFNVPVVMTGRGEDMLRFPDMPFKGKAIRWALKRAAHCVALSSEIADAMKRHGADAEKVSVIPNGVDTETFRPLPQRNCREKLRLPGDAKIILSVGDRLELKGFHLLVDAMPSILEEHPNAFLAIVGGPGRFGRDYTAEIEERIRTHQLQDRVLLAGARPHDELPLWYNAADVFALLSSREGSPNVLVEALACGVPAVGTAVGGIGDELSDLETGQLLPERTADAAANQICTSLRQASDPATPLSTEKSRSWNSTAQRAVAQFFRIKR